MFMKIDGNLNFIRFQGKRQDNGGPWDVVASFSQRCINEVAFTENAMSYKYSFYLCLLHSIVNLIQFKDLSMKVGRKFAAGEKIE